MRKLVTVRGHRKYSVEMVTLLLAPDHMRNSDRFGAFTIPEGQNCVLHMVSSTPLPKQRKNLGDKIGTRVRIRMIFSHTFDHGIETGRKGASSSGFHATTSGIVWRKGAKIATVCK
jgi:hypothetical protein